MSIIKKMRKQAVIYWALTTEMDSSGNPVFAAPVDGLCRWEEGNPTLLPSSLKEPGTRFNFKALSYVDRAMLFGDYLMLGSVSSSTPADPRDAESWEVMAFEALPNLKAAEYLYTVHMYPSHLKIQALHGIGVRTITYNAVTSSSIGKGGRLAPIVSSTSVAVAVKGETVGREEERYLREGDFSATTTEWHIPKRLLPAEPKFQDWFTDILGTRWNVIGQQEGVAMRSWWVVRARRGA